MNVEQELDRGLTINFMGTVLLSAGKGQPPPFSPTQIPGLQLWLKADAGVFQDNTLTTPAILDGDLVGGWADQSTLGHNLTQTIAGNKGQLKLAVQNGKQVVRFNGVSQFLVSALITSIPQPITVLTALSFTSGTRYFASRSVAFRLGNNGNYAGTADVVPTTPVSGVNTVSIIMNGASSLFWKNGAANGGGNPGVNGLDGFTVASAENGSGQFSACDLYEILVYNSSLATAQRQACEAYLKNRWATP